MIDKEWFCGASAADRPRRRLKLLDALVIAVLLLTCWWIEARAADCRWVVATVASKHFGEKPGANYNESNWGLGGEHCLGEVLGMELRGVAGFYRNSYRIDSLYVGGSATMLRAGPLGAGIAAALVSGYQAEPIPAVFPVLALEADTFGANLSYFPGTKTNTAALGLQLKWRFR
jgi:hypothetical protein